MNYRSIYPTPSAGGKTSTEDGLVYCRKCGFPCRTEPLIPTGGQGNARAADQQHPVGSRVGKGTAVNQESINYDTITTPASSSPGSLGLDDPENTNYINIPGVSASDTATFAVSFSPDEIQEASLFFYGGTGINASINGASSRCYFYLTGAGACQSDVVTMTVGAWHRLVCTYNNSTFAYTIYFDGTLIGSGTKSPYAMDLTPNGYIGYYAASGFNGSIRDCILFGDVKDQTWVTADYSEGEDATNGYVKVYTDEDNPLSYYKCDEAVGATEVLDYSGNDNTSLNFTGTVTFTGPTNVVEESTDPVSVTKWVHSVTGGCPNCGTYLFNSDSPVKEMP